jgi:O-antigen/teichoic acid export membrane protein
MGIIIRQSVKSTIVSYVGVGIGIFNIVFLATRYFSASQVGLSRVVFENAVLFTSIAHLGVPYIAIKYFARFKGNVNHQHGFLVFLLVYGLVGFLFFSLLYLFSKQLFVHYYQSNSPELIEYYYYLLPIVLFSIYLNIFEAYCQVNERIVVPTIVREIFLKFSNSVLIFLFALHVIDFDRYLFGMIIIMGIGPLLLIGYLKKLGKLDLKKDFSFLNKSSFKEMMTYGLFIVLGGIGNILATKIDVLMLPAMTNLQSTGIYVIAIFIAMVIEIPKRSISQITTPILANAISRNDMKQVDELYKKTALNQLIVGLLLFLLIWCNIDAIFVIMPNTAVYNQGKYVVFFIALSRLVDMASGVNTEIILNSKYFRFGLTSIAVLAILTISTNLIFIPVYGINGAAFAAALSIFIYTLIKLTYVWIRFRLQPYTQKSLQVIALSLIPFAVTLIFPVSSDGVVRSMIFLVVKSTLIFILFTVLILKFRVSEDVNNLVKALLKKVKR